MKLSISDLRKVADLRSGAAEEVTGTVRLSIMVAQGCPRELMVCARASLRPTRAGGKLHIEGFGAGEPPAANSLSDAALVLLGANSPLETAGQLVLAYAQAGVPVAVGGLFATPEEAQATEAELVAEGVPEAACFLGLDAEVVLDALGSWLNAALPKDAAAAAAANFPCCRRARARVLVAQACQSNALVGLLGFVPGADLPVMTLTQTGLALRLAAIYDQPLTSERLRELVPVVASAFGMRGVARLLVDVLPVPASIVRAGVGAGGTYAAGCALAAWFEAQAAQAHETVQASGVSAGERA